MAKETSANDQLMAQKVNRVREVVANVSKNDVVLALHSHDLDVDRTIQALMEGGALDEWVRPAGSGKNKKKNQQKAPEAPKVVAPVVSSSKPKVAAPVVPTVPLTSQTKKVAAEPAPISNGVNGTHNKTDTSSVDAASAESTRISGQWAAECAQGRKSIADTFKSLQGVLAAREKWLLEELGRQEKAAAAVFANHAKSFETIGAKLASGADVSGDLRSIQKAEASLLASDVFSYDMSGLVKEVNAFGRVFTAPGSAAAPSAPIAVPTVTAAPLKDSVSRASVVSSVDNDSGVGSEKQTPAKVVSTTGGMKVASDGITAAQLAEIQRQVQEKLAASGITTDFLAGVTTGGDIIARRPKKKEDKAPRPGQEKKGAQKNPKLSILNN